MSGIEMKVASSFWKYKEKAENNWVTAKILHRRLCSGPRGENKWIWWGEQISCLHMQLINICIRVTFLFPALPCRAWIITAAFIWDLASIFDRVIVIFALSPLEIVIVLGFALVLIICGMVLTSGCLFWAAVLTALKGLDTTVNGGPESLDIIRCGLEARWKISECSE